MFILELLFILSFFQAVAWQTTWCNEYSIDLEIKSDLDSQLETILQQLEIIFGKEQVSVKTQSFSI